MMGRLKWAAYGAALKRGDGIWLQSMAIMLSIPILLALLIIVLVLLVIVVTNALPGLLSLSLQLLSVIAALAWFWLKQMLAVILLTGIAVSLTALLFDRLTRLKAIQEQLAEPAGSALPGEAIIKEKGATN